MKINRKIFAKFFWGMESKEEFKQVIESEESIELLNNQWNNTINQENQAKSFEQEKIKQNLLNHINQTQRPIYRIINQPVWVKLAASLALIFSMSIAYFWLAQKINTIRYIKRLRF